MIVIGEKINSSVKEAQEIIHNREEENLIDLARRQAEAGAAYIDVNVGTGLGSSKDEVAAMNWAVDTIQRELDNPLCIDSADHTVLEAGILTRDGRPSLINSVKGEKEGLDKVLPLAAKHNVPVVALLMDERGIPMTTGERMEVCEKIVGSCEEHGVPLDSVFFDPLVLPVSTDINQGNVTLYTIVEIKKAYPQAKTVMGLSNISYGLPQRARLNKAFLHMAIFAGLDSAIMDPLDREMMDAIKTAQAILGRDRHCRKYTRAFRKR